MIDIKSWADMKYEIPELGGEEKKDEKPLTEEEKKELAEDKKATRCREDSRVSIY